MKRYSTVLAPGTSFVEDNFSMGQGVEGGSLGMIQAHDLYHVHFISIITASALRQIIRHYTAKFYIQK